MLVSFACPQGRIGLEAQHVRGSRSIGSDEPMSAIPRLAELLGLPASGPMRQPTCLLLKTDLGSAEVLVEGPVELVSLPVRQVFPLPRLVAATSCVRGLRALALTDSGAVLLIGLPKSGEDPYAG